MIYGPQDPWGQPRRLEAERNVTCEVLREEEGQGEKTPVRFSGEKLVLDGASDRLELTGAPAAVSDPRGDFQAPTIIYGRSDGRIFSPAGGMKRLTLKAQPKPASGGEDKRGGNPAAAGNAVSLSTAGTGSEVGGR
jgi:hypothetical protein